MFNIISRYISKMTKEDINKFALSKGANLSEEELSFTYDFIKRNYAEMLKNPALFDIERYKNKYSEKNFTIIKKVFSEYFSKYSKFL